MLRHRTLTRSKFLAAVALDCLRQYAASQSLASPTSLDEDEVARWLARLDEAEQATVMEDWQSINDVADYAFPPAPAPPSSRSTPRSSGGAASS